ncbi:MAG: hypothetical protein J6O09_01675 [Lachnospiraceae bacterium]|nr:hypothetical protein [Lachnospiraceae bacterium]
MIDNQNKNKILPKVLAWIGLVIITIFLFIIAYAMMTQNGRLALAFIIGLIFISIIYAIGIKLYKDAVEYRKLQNKEKEREDFINIASINTKSI